MRDSLVAEIAYRSKVAPGQTMSSLSRTACVGASADNRGIGVEWRLVIQESAARASRPENPGRRFAGPSVT